MPDPDRRPPTLDVPVFGAEPQLVASAYGLGTVRRAPRFAARGELGRIWRLSTTTGDWAIKELFTDLTEAVAGRDVDFQLAAHAQGVSMPLPRRRPDGATLTRIPAGSGSSLLVRAYSWVELAPGPQPASADQAAEQLGRLHASPFPDDSEPDPWFVEPFDDARWPTLVESAREARAGWLGALERSVPALVAANRIVRTGGFAPTVRCHLDYNPQNVLVGIDGAAVVVDWENSGPATVDQEVASAIAEFTPEPAGVPGFCRGYLSAGGAPVALTEASFTVTLAAQAHLLAWYVSRALDPEVSAENRARAAFWIDDMCRLLITVEQVHAWLAAAAPLLR